MTVDDESDIRRPAPARWSWRALGALLTCLLMAAPPASAAPTIGIHPSPLRDLPSEEGPHLARIRALEAGAWLGLGAPAPDPSFGGARGATWGAYALQYDPVRRGAYRGGEGRHANVKPDGYGQDDFWYYDIHQHRWLCLYPGTAVGELLEQVKRGDIKVDAQGRAITGDGEGAVPGHLLIHAWGFLAVNGETGHFRFLAERGFDRYYMPGIERDAQTREATGPVHEAIELLETQGLGTGKPSLAPWRYDAQSGHFNLPLSTNRQPQVGGYPAFVYVPEEKQFFLAGAKGQAFFDPKANKWRQVKSPTRGPDGYDFGATVDTHRNEIYMGQSADKLHVFDIEESRWREVPPTGLYEALPFRNNEGGLYYDTNRDVVVAMSFKARRIGLLDPQAKEWIASFPMADDFPRKRTNAVFYDPQLEVFFIYTAGNSRDDGEMWVYRTPALP